MDRYVNTAIIGTGQTSSLDVTSGSETDALIGQMAEESREQRLLLAAGAASIYRRAGYKPAHLPEQPVGAEPEEQEYAPQSIDTPLKQILQGGYRQVRLEALQLLREARLLLPTKFLPLALDMGTISPEYQAELYPLLGKRGLWLGQFQPQWGWVSEQHELDCGEISAEAEKIWQEGTTQQRHEILSRARRIDASVARSWLMSTWEKEGAGARKTFLGTFELELSLRDEAFLEEGLADRSIEVRKKAADLLGKLACSAFSRRMQVRAEELFRYQGEHIQVHLPRALDADWKHDGLEGSEVEDLRNSVTWIRQILRNVPLSFWEKRFRPEQLIGALGNTAEDQMILSGWSEAASRFDGPDWHLPLWDWRYQIDNKEIGQWWYRVGNKEDYTSETPPVLIALLQNVSQQESERLVIHSIEQDQSWRIFLAQLHRPWSAEFSSFFLQGLRAQLEEGNQQKVRPALHEDDWCLCLPEAATGIAPEYFASALEIAKKQVVMRSNTSDWTNRLKGFKDIIRMRSQIREGIQK